VEPEVLIDGGHSIGQFADASQRVVAACVAQLWRKGVQLEACLLKPQMAISVSERAANWCCHAACCPALAQHVRHSQSERHRVDGIDQGRARTAGHGALHAQIPLPLCSSTRWRASSGGHCLSVWPPALPVCLAPCIACLSGPLHCLSVWPPALPVCLAPCIADQCTPVAAINQGSEFAGPRPTSDEVATHTLNVMRRVVPPAIPGAVT